MSLLSTWALQIRGPFLLLSVVLVLIGGGAAHHADAFDGLSFALSMVGVILAHAAVNLLNEHSDHRTRIDHHTRRTPFSGGSGLLQSGRTSSRAVLLAAYAALALALAIGVLLSWRSSWRLMLLVVSGGLATLFYTSHLSRWMLGELTAGLCLGTFVVLGSFYAQAGRLTPEVIWLSIPPGVLTALLLLLNELPDVEADRRGGRRHLVIVLGRRRAAVLYTAALAAVYALLVAGVLLRLLPSTVLLALLTLPLGIKASRCALRHGADVERLIPGLGANVGLVLGTDLLLAIACFVA
jgi:1,4-dihydroxy-2-naphthoate octaprenyltransferase